ncbi:hypothetical protein [Gordonia westfalica]|uniref:Ig-like domain-containing protein n=1 Tax=Gordonia westfalica TaxID=158898 RepID=A0A1H2KMK2_9ACTN|nr:hypothetical protein [Gordonia westfalica]SDU69586.1 hypothetical protein SAMN04488548_1343404 [Gordonia westfalica]
MAKKILVGLLLAAAVTGTGGGIGGASAAPTSVQREGGPCYKHEFGKDSADGKLYCSAEGDGIWRSYAVTRAPKVHIGTSCPTLGARAMVYQTDGIATCRQSNSAGLRWQW